MKIIWGIEVTPFLLMGIVATTIFTIGAIHVMIENKTSKMNPNQERINPNQERMKPNQERFRTFHTLHQGLKNYEKNGFIQIFT